MNSVPSRKEELEIEKLRLEAETERARRELAQAERLKVEAEIEELKARLAAREWVWQRAQYVAIVLGIFFTAGSFVLSVREEARRNLLTASEHLFEGYPSGAVELADSGKQGLRILVKSIDPTHQLEQKSWPVTTRAALLEIQRLRDDLTPEQKEDLRKAMLRSDATLRNQLTAYARMLRDSQVPKEAISKLKAEVRDLYCIQRDLQAIVTEGPPPSWKNTHESVLSLLFGEPQC